MYHGKEISADIAKELRTLLADVTSKVKIFTGRSTLLLAGAGICYILFLKSKYFYPKTYHYVRNNQETTNPSFKMIISRKCCTVIDVAVSGYSCLQRILNIPKITHRGLQRSRVQIWQGWHATPTRVHPILPHISPVHYRQVNTPQVADTCNGESQALGGSNLAFSPYYKLYIG